MDTGLSVVTKSRRNRDSIFEGKNRRTAIASRAVGSERKKQQAAASTCVRKGGSASKQRGKEITSVSEQAWQQTRENKLNESGRESRARTMNNTVAEQANTHSRMGEQSAGKRKHTTHIKVDKRSTTQREQGGASVSEANERSGSEMSQSRECKHGWSLSEREKESEREHQLKKKSMSRLISSKQQINGTRHQTISQRPGTRTE
ncbi:uncharacterized protein DMAD_01831 [Drosophila madeirensis]|uniref:Uncharacterized protein n=1 Tax=Drosophila madeirensis TaxID=30013 RepID=A0AAU9G421_DROMD